MKDENYVVLVTGASSGLGLAVAKYLASKGLKVYAGARSFKEVNNSCEVEDSCKGLHRVFLDVTNQESIDKLIHSVMKEEGRVDILVNCAAYLVLGAVEDTFIEEYSGVLDTNFLGTVRMCKSVLPVMRKQKKGLIINFSSINGLLATPFQSAYVSSKFAIEGLTEALSMEVKDFGIDVTLVEPSDHKSGSRNYRPHARCADNVTSPYYERFIKVTNKIEHDETNGSDPEKLAAVVYNIISTRNRKLRYIVGKFDQRLSTVLKKLLPGRLFEKLIYGYYNS
jgi:NAD(P)-dependent dehydrogenase (short-subunit alcohol dehydrogenase family)